MKFLIFIFVCIGAILVYDLAHTLILARRSASLIKNTTPFTRTVSNPAMRILVLGDSTAYGTGATDSLLSTAGRLGSLYPEAEVRNLAVNGLKIDGLLKIMDTLDNDEHFDIVLIQIGANDIIRLTPQEDMEKGIAAVLKRVQSLGDRVIVLHSGNIGESPFFPWYLKPLLSKRSFETREIYMKQAAVYGAQYVDLIDSPVAKLLKEKPETYYAKDFLHLTNAGYGLWFDEIRKQL